MHNTEDKTFWVNHGRSDEDVFVSDIAPRIGLVAMINPEKKTNPYVPDLVVNNQLAELKHQTTPFFKAEILYKISNQYAVTFNKKDYLNYSANHPDLIIYYWVNWKELSKTIRGEIISVKPLIGVWRIPFSFFSSRIEENKAPLHTYIRRVEDNEGNAKDRYLFDLREFECVYIKEPKSI